MTWIRNESEKKFNLTNRQAMDKRSNYSTESEEMCSFHGRRLQEHLIISTAICSLVHDRNKIYLLRQIMPICAVIETAVTVPSSWQPQFIRY